MVLGQLMELAAMVYKIEDGVQPAPVGKTGNTEFYNTLNQMKVGQSFLVPGTGKSNPGLGKMANSWVKGNLDRKVVVQAQDGDGKKNGYRVFMLAGDDEPKKAKQK